MNSKEYSEFQSKLEISKSGIGSLLFGLIMMYSVVALSKYSNDGVFPLENTEASFHYIPVIGVIIYTALYSFINTRLYNTKAIGNLNASVQKKECVDVMGVVVGILIAVKMHVGYEYLVSTIVSIHFTICFCLTIYAIRRVHAFHSVHDLPAAANADNTTSMEYKGINYTITETMSSMINNAIIVTYFTLLVFSMTMIIFAMPGLDVFRNKLENYPVILLATAIGFCIVALFVKSKVAKVNAQLDHAANIAVGLYIPFAILSVISAIFSTGTLACIFAILTVLQFIASNNIKLRADAKKLTK